MTVTVSATDPRSLKALDVLATFDRWQKGHLKSSGRSFYAVPSSTDSNRLYLVDTRACDCPDFVRRQQPCKHVLAVRMAVLKGKIRSNLSAPTRVPLVGRLAV